MKKFILSLALLVSALKAYAFNVALPNVMQYGATGNGSTDDTAAIQTALTANGGGYLIFPPGNYKVSASLNLPTDIHVLGSYSIASSSATTTQITETANVPVFLLASSGNANAITQNVTIDGFLINGGSVAVEVPNSGVWMTFNNITAANPSFAALDLIGYANNLNVSNWDMIGGQYGIIMSTGGPYSGGAGPTIQGSNFNNLYINGQLINNVFMDMTGGGGYSDSFTNIQLITAHQDAMVLAGFSGLTMTNVSGEGYCNQQSAQGTYVAGVATTTASSAIVAVSNTGFVNGSTLTIQGAGGNGVDWYPVVQSGGGTNSLTMTTTAPTSVNSKEVTNALYSIIKFAAGEFPSNSSAITINNAAMISPSDGYYCRYAIDATYATNMNVFSPQTTNRPIYDPQSSMTTFGSNGSFTIRRPNNLIAEGFGSPEFGGTGAPRTQIPSPQGGNIVMGLVDSNGNGTGTYGTFSINRLDSSRDPVFNVDNLGNVTLPFGGGYTIPAFSVVSLQTMTPKNNFEIVGCSNCSTVPVCISTGTAEGQWALVTNRGSTCQ